MLICSTGASFSSHFCGGSLQGLGFGDDATSCHHDEVNLEACCSTNVELKVEKQCCTTNTQTLLVQEEYAQEASTPSYSQLLVSLVFVYVYFSSHYQESFTKFWLTSKPPLKLLDAEAIRLLYQCFRL